MRIEITENRLLSVDAPALVARLVDEEGIELRPLEVRMDEREEGQVLVLPVWGDPNLTAAMTAEGDPLDLGRLRYQIENRIRQVAAELGDGLESGLAHELESLLESLGLVDRLGPADAPLPAQVDRDLIERAVVEVWDATQNAGAATAVGDRAADAVRRVLAPAALG